MASFDRQLPAARAIEPSHFLYPQVIRECAGVTTPKVWPEEAADGWRCTCGCENPPESDVCAGCGVSRAWLCDHFDRAYLAAEQAKAEDARAAERIETRRREKKRRARSRTARAAALLAAAAAVLCGIVLVAVLVISPAIAYRDAESLRGKGAYLEAADAFLALGKADEAAACHRLHAEKISGKADVYAVTTADYPCFRITADGALSVEHELLGDAGVPLDPLVIPDVVDDILVTSLAERGFMNADEVVSLVVPASVTAIGERCFFKCTSMTGILLPDGLLSLGERAFINCTALETLTIPDGITAIPVRLCNNCLSLRAVRLPEGITAIGAYAFSSCQSLGTVELPAACRTVGEYAFSDCGALSSAVYHGARGDLAVGESCDDLLAVLTYED